MITCGIYLYNVNNQKLLVCHATHSSWKNWSIPKGLKNDNENTFSAAARELKEETGIDIFLLSVLQTHTLPPVKYRKQNKILESFLVITDTNFDGYSYKCHTLNNDQFPEVDNWKWISLDKIISYLHKTQQENMESIKKLTQPYNKLTRTFLGN